MRVVKTLADIALWRRGPADLPESAWLLGVAMALYFIQSCVQSRLMTHDDGALVAAVVDLCVSSGLIVALLSAARRAARAPQTLLALLGTEVLLAPAVIAVLLGQGTLGAADPTGQMLRLLLLGLIVWDRLIAAHVLRCAFDVSLGAGIALSLATAVAGYLFASWLSPLPAPARI